MMIQDRNTVIFIIVLLALHAQDACEVFKETLGVTSPAHDIILKNGSLLVINCTLFPGNFPDYIPSDTTSADVRFYRDWSYPISNQYVEIIDNVTAQLKLPSVTVNQTGSYQCFVHLPGVANNGKKVKNAYVCGNIVKVGFPPLTIEDDDFNCVSQNWYNMTCYWNVPDDNPVPTKYNLSYYYPLAGGKKSKEFKCPVYSSKTSCLFSLDLSITRVAYKQSAKFYIFILRGKNELGKSSHYYLVKHYGVVLPNKPVDVRVRRRERRSLEFEWRSPMELDLFPPGLDYQVRYISEWEDKKNNADDDWQVSYTRSNDIRLRNLYPHSKYTIRVHCKSHAAKNLTKWWSEYNEVEEWTLSDVPRTPVQTTIGMFEDHLYDNSRRSVTIYWKPIPAYLQNGRNFVYVLNVYESNGREVSPVSKRDQKTTKFYETFNDLKSNVSYTFVINVANEMGMLPEIQSSIFIDRKSNVPRRPKDVIAQLMSNGTYQVSWTQDGVITPTSYTIFWCKRHTIRRCDQPMEWITVPANRNKVLVNLPDVKDVFYQFAMSSNDGRSSSGLTWVACMVQQNGAPVRVQGVTAYSITPTQLKISWKVDCIELSDAVRGYYIYYCTTKDANTCSGMISRMFVDQRGVVVKDLNPFTDYKIYVTTVSRSYEESEKSEPFVGTTRQGIPSTPDPPDLIYLTNTTISIAWRKPAVSNGVITSYYVHYNDYAIHVDPIYAFKITSNVKPYANYKVSVSACTIAGCSKQSEHIDVKTGVGVPGQMDAPRFEVINSTYVKVYWHRPRLPNGPLNICQLSVKWFDDENITMEMYRNYTKWTNVTFIRINCPAVGDEQDLKLFNITVRAANIDYADEDLYGDWSDITKIKMCFQTTEALAIGFMVGIVVGSTLALTLIILIVCFVMNWAKQQMLVMNRVSIQLPKGLADTQKVTVSYTETDIKAMRYNNNSQTVKFSDYNIMFGYNNDSSDRSTMYKYRHESGDSAYSSGSMQELMFKQKKIVETPLTRRPSDSSSESKQSVSSKTHPSNQSADSGVPYELGDVQALSSPLSSDHVFLESTIGVKGSDKEEWIDSKEVKLKTFGTRLDVGNNQMTVGFMLTGHGNHIPTAYSKFGLTALKGDYIPLHPEMMTVYNKGKIRNLSGSESNLHDIDSGQESDGNYQSKFQCFGLSNSHTDISKQFIDYVTNYDRRNHPTPKDDIVMNHIPYSKFGILNLPTKLHDDDRYKCHNDQSDNNVPSYVTIGDVMDGRPKMPKSLPLVINQARAKLTSTGEDSLTSSPDYDDYNDSFMISYEKKSSDECSSHNSEIFVCSTVADKCRSNGYVPNSFRGDVRSVRSCNTKPANGGYVAVSQIPYSNDPDSCNPSTASESQSSDSSPPNSSFEESTSSFESSLTKSSDGYVPVKPSGSPLLKPFSKSTNEASVCA